MTNLTKQQVSDILSSLDEISEFKYEIQVWLKKSNMGSNDIKNLGARLDSIESNLEYIIDLLGG